MEKNPANQLRLVVYPIISKDFYVPGGCLEFLNHQQYHGGSGVGKCVECCNINR